MKTSLFLFVTGISLLLSCNSDPVRRFMPGSYVNHSAGEFSVADDTLLIRSSGANSYVIVRKTGFNLVRAGKTGKRDYETENWNAVYDEGTKVLLETRRGKQLIFVPDSGKLMLGKRAYRKIN